MDEQQRTQEELKRRVLTLREQYRRTVLPRVRELRQAQVQAIAELGYDPARPPRPPRIEGVAWRCERCSRSLGRHAPALAILERVDEPHPWAIRPIVTSGRSFELPGRPRTQDRIQPGPTETNHGYACRRCRYKPRVKAPELFALADQAFAKGRDYFYR